MTSLKKASAVLVAGLAVSSFQSSVSFAAGFEKATMWSGHYAGQGGAAVAAVNDSEALYFNPAGLGAVRGLNFSANLSPTFSMFRAPLLAPNSTYDGNRISSLPFGVTAAFGVSDQLTVGAGIYVSGGDRAEYNGVDLSGGNAAFSSFSSNIRTDLTVLEYSLGVGYELMDGLRLGLSYRIVHVNASVDFAGQLTSPAAGIANITEDDLTGTRYNGFKVGAQYAPQDSRWGLGAAWRTPIDFTANGTRTTTAFLPAVGGLQASASADGSLSGVFPSQVLVGGYYDVLDKVRGFLEYDWTNYAANSSLDATGGLISIPTGWQDMGNYRIGLDCSAKENWDFRLGYVYTTQVTPTNRATATLASPGNGNTVTLGAGTSFMDKMLMLDAALEYSWAKGTVTTEGPTPGDYSSNDYAIHLGATYQF